MNYWKFNVTVWQFLFANLHVFVCVAGTCHDWRLRCDAVNLYYTLFGLTRPSCLPLPELGLVLNLKEKKAVLNPTIKSEQGPGGPEVTSNMTFTSTVSISLKFLNFSVKIEYPYAVIGELYRTTSTSSPIVCDPCVLMLNTRYLEKMAASWE